MAKLNFKLYRVIKMWQNRKPILLLFGTFIISFIWLVYTLRAKVHHHEVVKPVVTKAHRKVPKVYFVDTVGCRISYFEICSTRLAKYMSLPATLKCNLPLTRTSDVGSTLWWTMTDEDLRTHYYLNDVSNISCFYTELQRQTDFQSSLLPKPTAFRLKYNHSLEIPKEMEFIRVWCKNTNGITFYEDYHFFALNKSVNVPHDEDSQEPMKVNGYLGKSKALNKQQSTTKINSATPHHAKLAPLKKPISLHATSLGSISPSLTAGFLSSSSTHKINERAEQRLSLMVLGIDSLSHMNFLRYMKRTAEFIHTQLEHVELWGFHKVSDNAFPNMMPMLSGLSQQELEQSCIRADINSDCNNCTFLWRRYKEAGYTTAYLEDVGRLGLFNSYHKSFVDPPTDYYLRPVALEMERNVSYKSTKNVHLCAGGRRTVDLVLEMLRKLIPYFKTQDFFSFCWTVSLTHDIVFMPKRMDNDFVQLFQLLETSGVLNKTVVFLMSGHGIKFGAYSKTYQGTLEKHLPLFIAIFPKWFKAQYPLAIKNMEKNSRRLTSLYDVHQTALDLLNVSNLNESNLKQRATYLYEAKVKPRGISLFLPVPEERTCKMAGIEAHQCVC